MGAHIEPKACGILGTYRQEDPIVSSCHLGSKLNSAPCLQKGQPQEWIVVKVSQALREELPNIIGRVIDRVVTRFEERASVTQAVHGLVEVT